MNNFLPDSFPVPLGKIISLALLVSAAMGVLMLMVTLFGGVAVTDTDNSRDLVEALSGQPDKARFFLAMQHILLFIMVPLCYHGLWYISAGNRLFFWGNPSWKDYVRFLAFLMLMFPVISVTAMWMSALDLPKWMQQMDADYLESLQGVMKMESVMDVLFTVVIAAVLPGIGEELFFRGIVQQELVRQWKKPHLAIWMTAVLFSLLHFQATGFVAKMLIGLVLGYAYYFTTSLWVPVLLHITNNASATWALYYYGTGETDKIAVPGFSWSQLCIFGAGIFSVFLYYRYLAACYKIN